MGYVEATRPDAESFDTSAISRSEFYLLPPVKTNNPEKTRKNGIFMAATSVGADLMEATGGEPISVEQLDALHFRNYLDYPSREILENSYFHSLDDFNSEVHNVYEHRLETREFQKQQILDTIAASSLPSELFKDIDYEGQLGQLTDREVDDDKKITRYAKYVLGRRLIMDVRDDLNELRLLGIALGLFLKEQEGDGSQSQKSPLAGKKTSSFQSEIRKATNDMVTQADVEIAAEYQGWYDLIFPNRKTSLLDEIRQAALTPIIIPLEEANRLYKVRTDEIFIDVDQRVLALGAAAIEAVAGYPEASPQKIGELLLQEELNIDLADKYHSRFKEFTRQDCIDYGKWLLALINNQEDRFDKRLLQNAYHLGLGPGPKSITNKNKRYPSLHEFYKNMGLRRRRPGWYTHWTFDTAVKHLQAIASEHDGRVTKDMIRERIENGSTEPSPKVYESRWGFNSVLEAAGVPTHNPEISTEVCVEAGVRFYEQNGRLPKKGDIAASDDIPSEYSLRKYCGGIKGFQRMVSARLEELKLAA